MASNTSNDTDLPVHRQRIEPSLTRSSSRSLLRYFVVILAWVAIVVCFVRLLRQWPSLEQWRQILTKESLGAAALLLGAVVMVTALRAYRWGLLIRQQVRVPFAELLIRFMWWFFLSAVSPFRAGDIVRPLWVRRQGGSMAWAMGALVVERLTDLIILVSMTGMVIALIPVQVPWINQAGLLTLGLFTAGVLLGFYLAPVLEARLQRKSQAEDETPPGFWRARVLPALGAALSGIAQYRQVHAFMPVLALTALIWMLLLAGYVFFLDAFFPGIHWAVVGAVLVAVNLSGLISVGPANIGMFHLAAVGVLTVAGYEATDAFVAAVGVHALVFSAVTIQGILGRVVLWIRGEKLINVV